MDRLMDAIKKRTGGSDRTQGSENDHQQHQHHQQQQQQQQQQHVEEEEEEEEEDVYGEIYADTATLNIHDKPADFWYHGDLDREEVSELLRSEGRKTRDGTFLVRPSTRAGGYVLSVRDGYEVRHLLLYQTPLGMFRIMYDPEFATLPSLLTYYCTSPDSFIHLTAPYTKEMAKTALAMRSDPWEVDPGLLKLGDLLGKGHFGFVRQAVWRRRIKVAVKIFNEGVCVHGLAAVV
ncbi:hypothetical protein Pmani_031777 [Petrolisthes manimaculis]|uniref:SH2 domain-containing protein n=1 Tax=Petrolisthes manimaculis TaxID=1843537 RepID=A0AAE1NUQ2_9EUCA|nr:hypothetical protein Pmani_031777 [Petrolisthes manimaculis]